MAENKRWKSIPINRMGDVAGLFGMELYEAFKIESNVHKVAKTVRFSDDGLQYYDAMCQKWYNTDGFLRELLTGEAVILD